MNERTRRTLQLAAVIGRSFQEPVLRAVSGDDPALEYQLSTLERLGLIEETARLPEREYAFHHSLTQEAVYSTILLRGRRELHLAVGEVLEELCRRLEEFAPLLVKHFQEAGDDTRTVIYAAMAGDNAARLYANAEAVTHLTNALAAARRLGLEDAAVRDLQMSLDRALELRSRADEPGANQEERGEDSPDEN